MYDRAIGIKDTSPFRGEVVALVSVHRFSSFAICSITDPRLNMTGGLPTGGQETMLDVVGASVCLIVGEEVLPLVGENVGNGVGGSVVR